MRPLVLVLALASLGGCVSVAYQGKEFKAIEKPELKAPGGGHESHEGGEHEGHEGAEHATEEAKEPIFEHTEPVVKSSFAFPKTAQPTGRPPVMITTEKVGSSVVKVEGE